jgi:hypothetical protein
MKRFELRVVACGLFFAIALLALPGRGEEKSILPATGSMLEQGLFTFYTPQFILRLVRSSQTVAALKPHEVGGLDFTPGDRLAERYQPGFYHLGDIDLRLRSTASGEWQNYSTARSRAPVTSLPVKEPLLASADLAPALGAGCPLQVTRTWLLEGETLVLRYQLKNNTAQPVQVGALAIPMVFNNIINDRDLDEAHVACSFNDPYIGLNAGYLQVTRLNGKGPALLVVPDGRTPFEAWNPILDPRRPGPGGAAIFTDPTPRGHTFEGFYSWMVHSKAYAENEWRGARPWNPPTGLTLAPGETKSYGLRFLLSDEIRHIEQTLAANDRPVAIGIPGYVLPMDTEGRLFLRNPSPVRSLQVEPAGALEFRADKPTPGDWQAYTLRGKAWGRARLLVTYEDGLEQAIHYYVIKPEAAAVSDLGRFLFTRQWFVDAKDPFKRSPAIMSYDRDENRIVTQESRVWIAGLGDEGGSSWLSGAMKLLGQPDKAQVDKYQQFIDQVLWGGLQISAGERKWGVRKSLFYYQPDQFPAGFYRSDLDWRSWTSWNKEHSERLERSYNYPHVAALHWVMYRLARNHPGLVTNRPWGWYLENAGQTALAMIRFAPYYTQFGNMEGSVFQQILLDLKREGMDALAAEVEAKMKARAEIWRAKAYPFGSEMPWDSTGQEEVYTWTKHFGDTVKAHVCIDAILGYMPALPHWGYNGSARRFWDFLYAGKLRRIERQLHHYGSSINAIPVLSEYRDHPDDFHLLRIGYGGIMGTLTNIDREGFAAAAFHAFPDTLRLDGISGDYAQNFFGHAMSTAAYLVDHPEFGWLAFGGNVSAAGQTVRLTPLDSFRSRVYLAPLGLWLTLEAGRFVSVTLDKATGSVQLELAGADRYTPEARLRIEQPARLEGVGDYKPLAAFAGERGAIVVPLHKASTWIELKPEKASNQ